MRGGLLTDRQIEVLRYRRKGLTQQQIADIIHTSKTNVWMLEKSAKDNIQVAKETMNFFYALDASHLCTLKTGTDLFDSAPLILHEAAKTGITLNADLIDLINRLRAEYPDGIHGRLIKVDIEVFLRNDGKLYFG